MVTQEAKDEIKGLREENEYLQDQLTNAAEAGISLLKTSQELQEKYETDCQYYQRQIEELRQENYTLSNKLSLQTATHQAFNEEIELVKSQTESEYQRRMSIMEQDHILKMQKITWELEEARSLVYKLQQNESSLKEKIVQQEGIIANMSKEADDRNDYSENVDEFNELQKKCNEYTCKIQELELQLSDQYISLKQQQDHIEAYEMRQKEIQGTLDERVKLSNEIYHELQEALESNKVLQSQVERNKLDRLEENWQNCGNSLFGEVEERRLETERQLICLQVKYETLDRTHQMLKQHFKKLKVDMSALLCRVGTFTADAAQVTRLQRSLQQRDSEVQSLHDKVYMLEKDITSMTSGKEQVGSQRKGYSHEFLRQQIVMKGKLIDSVKRELHLANTQRLWETTRLTETEGLLYKSEQDKAKLINDATAMKLQLNEIKENENELFVQLEVANKEIETLKLQLKTKLRKGGSSGGSQAQEPTITKSSPIPVVVQPKVIEDIKTVKPINLLEELEKENTIPSFQQSILHKTIIEERAEKGRETLGCPFSNSVVTLSTGDKPTMNNDNSLNQCPQQ